MARETEWTIYHEAPPKMAFSLNEGAWTDDDKYKDGGYFASPLDKDCYVVLDTSSNALVRKATTSESPIGKLITEPMGRHALY